VTEVLDQAAAGPSALGPDWWAGGLTLSERRALPGTPAPALGLVERAGRRLTRWRGAHGLGESGLFDRRLAAAGLAEHDLLALLAEDRAGLTARATRPGWAGVAEAALARAPGSGPVPEPAGPGPAALAGFSAIVAPFTELGSSGSPPRRRRASTRRSTWTRCAPASPAASRGGWSRSPAAPWSWS